jgi:hypothetical protein
MIPEAQLAMAKEILSILHADGGEDGMERQWRDQFTRLTGTDDRAWADLKLYFERRDDVRAGRQVHLNTLGLTPEADNSAIKTAYRNLAKDYHPDRLSNVSPAVRKLAEEKFKDLNLAYESLMENAAGEIGLSGLIIWGGQKQHTSALASSPGDIGHCFLCGQMNRLPSMASLLKARCGRCYALMALPEWMFQG